jgi:hypothetical protein
MSIWMHYRVKDTPPEGWLYTFLTRSIFHPQKPLDFGIIAGYLASGSELRTYMLEAEKERFS